VGLGALVLELGVALPRLGCLTVRPPLSILGTPGVATEPPALWDEIEAVAVAAVQNDAAAQCHLIGHRSRRYDANWISSGPPACARNGETTP
jgi:hypothetical protein